MKHYLLLFLIGCVLLLQSKPVLAAFPTQQTPSISQYIITNQTDTSNVKRPTNKKTAVYGIASLASSILVYPMLLVGTPLIIAGLFALAGIVFGAIGFNKKLKGLAIAGFLLGCILMIIIIDSRGPAYW